VPRISGVWFLCGLRNGGMFDGIYNKGVDVRERA
jgi:hypothetical protein